MVIKIYMICPECGERKNIIVDRGSKEIICRLCGLVIDGVDNYVSITKIDYPIDIAITIGTTYKTKYKGSDIKYLNSNYVLSNKFDMVAEFNKRFFKKKVKAF